jgi:hypothetical protein
MRNATGTGQPHSPAVRFSLRPRVAASICFILASAVSLTGLLNHYEYRNYLAGLLRDRHALALQDIGHNIEASLSLGLALDALPGVEADLQDSILQDPQVLSIEMFDERGIVLYSTDESLRGDLVSEDWVAKWNAGEPVWSEEEPDAHVVGLRVENSLGHAVGSLALRFSRTEFDENVQDMALRIAGLCAAIVVGFVLLGAVLSVFVTRPLRHRLQAMQAPIDPEIEIDTGADPDPYAVRFAETTEAARRAVADGAEEIRRIAREAGQQVGAGGAR